MNFCIQASNPIVQHKIDYEDSSLSDIIETIYPLYTEHAILTWNYISIPLSYKYDISYMIDDIIKLLMELHDKPSGNKIIYWLPDTFRCDWIVNWKKGNIKIKSKWNCTVGHLERLLNEVPEIDIPINIFINEWKEVLGNIIQGIKICGYDKFHAEEIQGLLECYAYIEESGILYK